MNEIRAFITVKIHCIFVEAGGHKLSLAKGAGIGTHYIQGIKIIVSAEGKEIDKFYAIEWRSPWVGGKKGVEGLEQVESPLVDAEPGFDCPYCHNDLPVDLEFGFNAIEKELVCDQMPFAGGNCQGGNKKGSILVVGFCFSLAIHKLEYFAVNAQVGKEQLKL
jgi:hypothetical protein